MTVPRKGGPRSGPYSAKRTLAGSATFRGDGRGWRAGPAPGCGAAEERKTRGFAPRKSRPIRGLATGYGPGYFWWHGVPHGTQLAPTRPPTVSTAGPGGLSACGWLSALLNLWPGSWLCLARATPAKAREASFCSKSGPGTLLGLGVRLVGNGNYSLSTKLGPTMS
jgi:hypothetical protein